LANGLVYAINRFKDEGAGFNMQDLSTNLSSLVKDAAEKVSAFKATVANQEFHLVFHPIVHVLTREIHHYEHPTRVVERLTPL